MFKNRIAKKLFLYFASALLLFSLVVGCVFIFLFRDNTMRVNKEHMLETATSISEAMSSYFSGEHGMMGYGAYLRSLEYIAGGNVWIIDEDLNILTSGAINGMHGKGRNVTYNDLPPNAENIVKRVMLNESVFSEEFSDLLSQTTLTLGVPIKNTTGEVFGAVLLHSAVNDINRGIYQGILLLGISLIIAFALSFVLSLWLSKRFTDPIVLKEAEDALKLEKIRQDFVANVSHELKTPITVIRGSVEALKDGVITEKEKVQEYYSQILSESKYLQSMVLDLLDLSKLQNADFPMEKSEINFAYVLKDAVRSIGGIAEAKGIKINLNIKNDDLTIMGDYSRLRQMLLIILDNAVKFSSVGEKVDVSCESGVIAIKDYGVGIAPDDLPFVFDRFRKSRNEKNKDGTGLGLAIAKQICDRHNITLTVKSEIGAGTEFFINF